jgi:mannosyltransferase
MTWLPGLESYGSRIWRRISPALILLVAFALRVYRLGDANLWWDEALAIWAVRKGLVGVTHWTAADVHPPLYFWSLWGWVQVAGQSEFAMRFLSVIIGVLTVAVVYRLGRLVGGRNAGLLASLLTALSRFHVWWSQEMRMYILAGLLGTLSMYLFLRWLRSLTRMPQPGLRAEPRWLLLIGYVLSTLGALYTIFLMGAWVLVQNLVVLVALFWPQGYRQKRLLVQWVVVQVAILAGLAAWLSFAWERMPTWSVSEPVAPTFILELYAVLLTAGASIDVRRFLWAVILPAVVTIWGVFALARRTQRGQAAVQQTLNWITLLLAVAVPPIIVYLSTLPRSLFYTPHVEARYFLPFAPAFWILLGWSVIAIGARMRKVAWALAIGLVVSWIVVLPGHYADRYLQDELQTMVRAIASKALMGDAVLLNAGSRYPVFLYYYELVPARMLPEVVTITDQERLLTPEEVTAWMEEHAEAYRRIWLAEVEANLSDPERMVRQALEERYSLLHSEGFGHNALFLYAPEDASAPRLVSAYEPQNTDIRGALFGSLRGWELPVRTFTPGDEMRLSLYWDRSPLRTVLLEMVNAQEQVVMRRRVSLNANVLPNRERTDLPVSPTLPAGHYLLRLAVEGQPPFELTQVRIADTLPGPPAHGPKVGLELIWGESIVLTGLSLEGDQFEVVELEPGETVLIDLYWRVERPPQIDYTVFVHLVGEAFNPATGGPLWGQHDAQPMDGMWPTHTWRTGEALVDRHAVMVDPAAPEGLYSLVLGLYNTETLQRLPVRDRLGQDLGDHLRLDMLIQVGSR